MNYVEPIRDPELIKDIGEYLKDKDEKLFIMYEIGIYSGLRISDILKLKVRDVKGKKTIKLRETKTGKEKMFPINAALQKELKAYCEDKKPYEYIVPKRGQPGKAVGRDYAYRVIHEAGIHFGLDNLGTHTMRKTFGYHFYKKTKDVVLLMKIFNHTSESRTLRYIGIEQTAINEAMMKFNYDY